MPLLCGDAMSISQYRVSQGACQSKRQAHSNPNRMGSDVHKQRCRWQEAWVRAWASAATAKSSCEKKRGSGLTCASSSFQYACVATPTPPARHPRSGLEVMEVRGQANEANNALWYIGAT